MSVNRSKTDQSLKRLHSELHTDAKFMDNFNPDKSLRSQRKFYESGAFDERGRYKYDGSDQCDCLIPKCPGCHFPCPMCKSVKCGSECRVGRYHAYESIRTEGKQEKRSNSVMQSANESESKKLRYF